jgi:hypothetical protein
MERQIQGMKYITGILKKRKDLIVKVSIKRFDWTLRAFKYSYNYQKYQKHIMVSAKT